jgi:hypothetical protein
MGESVENKLKEAAEHVDKARNAIEYGDVEDAVGNEELLLEEFEEVMQKLSNTMREAAVNFEVQEDIGDEDDTIIGAQRVSKGARRDE